ncbi:hypothetical protein L218DRAFT_940994 [Marasmius fiardii PR-910]|nr:hypothetical protein L218DRAFT_940994 [Marasmius fiardii PR-910]
MIQRSKSLVVLILGPVALVIGREIARVLPDGTLIRYPNGAFTVVINDEDNVTTTGAVSADGFTANQLKGIVNTWPGNKTIDRWQPDGDGNVIWWAVDSVSCQYYRMWAICRVWEEVWIVGGWKAVVTTQLKLGVHD